MNMPQPMNLWTHQELTDYDLVKESVIKIN